MSGIEILVLVGAGIYIHKKVKENKAKKRGLREATLAAHHGAAQEIEEGADIVVHPRYINHPPPAEQQTLPLYRAPTGKPPTDDDDDGEEATDTQWSKEIHLPSYDELSGSSSRNHNEADSASINTLSTTSSNHGSSSSPSPIASTSSSPTHLSPESAVKKHRLRLFKRSSHSKTDIPQEL